MGVVRHEDRITISDMTNEAEDQLQLARISEIAARNLGDDAWLLAEPEQPPQVPAYSQPTPSNGSMYSAPVSRSNQDYTYTPSKKQITLSREELAFLPSTGRIPQYSSRHFRGKISGRQAFD
jgi:hypothetical protein